MSPMISTGSATHPLRRTLMLYTPSLVLLAWALGAALAPGPCSRLVTVLATIFLAITLLLAIRELNRRYKLDAGQRKEGHDAPRPI